MNNINKENNKTIETFFNENSEEYNELLKGFLKENTIGNVRNGIRKKINKIL
jgi:hypothetical protein